MVRLFRQFLFFLSAMAGQDKNGLNAGFFSGADIAAVVPDQKGAGQFELVVFDRFFDQADLRFAAVAFLFVRVDTVFGVVGAIIKAVNVGAAVQDLPMDDLIDGLEHVFAKDPPGDAGLIGDNDDLVAGLVQLFDRGDRARDKMDLFRRADVS